MKKNHYKKNIFIVLTTILFSLAAPAASSGLFMVVKGQVKILGKDNKEAVAKVGSKIFVGDTVVTETDSRAKIVMQDRNVINLSPNTRLLVQEYTNEGSKKNVQLSLLEGKIRSNVEQKYDGEKNKYEVRTPTAVAGVRGTQFITNYDKSTEKTEVTTLTGQVEFKSLSPSAGDSKPIMVNEGERSTHSAGEAKPQESVKVAPDVLREIKNETTLTERDDRSSHRQNPPPPPPHSNIPNLNKNPLVDDSLNNKFDKTKIKVDPKTPTETPPAGTTPQPNPPSTGG